MSLPTLDASPYGVNSNVEGSDQEGYMVTFFDDFDDALNIYYADLDYAVEWAGPFPTRAEAEEFANAIIDSLTAGMMRIYHFTSDNGEIEGLVCSEEQNEAVILSKIFDETGHDVEILGWMDENGDCDLDFALLPADRLLMKRL